MRRPLALVSALTLLSAVVAPPAAFAQGADLCALVSEQAPAAGGGLSDAQLDALKSAIFTAFRDAGAVAEHIDTFVIEPIVTELTTAPRAPGPRRPGERRPAFDSAGVDKLLLSLSGIAFPAFGAAYKGGNIVVGGVSWAVEELDAATNPGFNVRIAQAADFFSYAKVRPAELGRRFQSERELENVWTAYEADFRALHGSDAAARAMRQAVRPEVFGLWKAQRTASKLRELRSAIAAQVAKAAAERGEAPTSAGIFGLWRTPSGSVMAVSSDGAAVRAVFCTVSPTAVGLGRRKGEVLYEGHLNPASADAGRTVVQARGEAALWRYEECKRVPKVAANVRRLAVKLTYDPDADTIRIREDTRKYNAKTCTWTDLPGTPNEFTWTRHEP